MTDLMPQRLTRDNLHGVWAAITTPFDAHDRFDAIHASPPPQSR